MPFPYRVGGRYRLQRRVAEGAMGTVFRAYDDRLEREVAVKVIKAEIFNQPAMRTRFEREARAVARIDHPGVVAVFDYGEILDEGSLYIVMEWLEGLDLARVLQLRGPGRPRDVAALVRQAGAGLAAAHARQLVHRDIKPANIFLTPVPGGFRVNILDFGVAKELSRDSKATQTGMIVGTPRFMSPEQLLSKPVDARSDIYSLAAVAFQALTGERLVRAEDFAQVLVEVVNEEPPKLSAILAQASRELDVLFARALAKDPEARPADVEEWADELAETLDSLHIDRPAWRIAGDPEVVSGTDDEETAVST
jgi:serine/threonine protein kinase